jgi:hypothetical protein
MPHAHGAAGENPAEILAFADSITRGGKPLPSFSGVTREGRRVAAAFADNARTCAKAELNVTRDTGKWKERRWEALPAALGVATVEAELPEGTAVWYFNLFTDDGLCVSSEHEVVGSR